MPTYQVVRRDETFYVNLPALGEDAPYFESVYSVYVYDSTICTHLCELTPSYELRFAYTDVVCKEGTPEVIRERLYDLLEVYDSDDIYLHCRDAEGMKHRTTVEADTLEEAHEYLQGNHCL